MALKNPAAEEWKPGFRYFGTGGDLKPQSMPILRQARVLMEGRVPEQSQAKIPFLFKATLLLCAAERHFEKILIN